MRSLGPIWVFYFAPSYCSPNSVYTEGSDGVGLEKRLWFLCRPIHGMRSQEFPVKSAVFKTSMPKTQAKQQVARVSTIKRYGLERFFLQQALFGVARWNHFLRFSFLHFSHHPWLVGSRFHILLPSFTPSSFLLPSFPPPPSSSLPSSSPHLVSPGFTSLGLSFPSFLLSSLSF